MDLGDIDPAERIQINAARQTTLGLFPWIPFQGNEQLQLGYQLE